MPNEVRQKSAWIGGSEAGHAAELAVAGVAEAGDDEHLVVQALVDRRR